MSSSENPVSQSSAVVRAYAERGRFCQGQGRDEQAAADLEQARQLFEACGVDAKHNTS